VCPLLAKSLHSLARALGIRVRLKLPTQRVCILVASLACG
jgi:hypothetical protein